MNRLMVNVSDVMSDERKCHNGNVLTIDSQVPSAYPVMCGTQSEHQNKKSASLIGRILVLNSLIVYLNS